MWHRKWTHRNYVSSIYVCGRQNHNTGVLSCVLPSMNWTSSLKFFYCGFYTMLLNLRQPWKLPLPESILFYLPYWKKSVLNIFDLNTSHGCKSVEVMSFLVAQLSFFLSWKTRWHFFSVGTLTLLGTETFFHLINGMVLSKVSQRARDRVIHGTEDLFMGTHLSPSAPQFQLSVFIAWYGHFISW